MPTQRFTLIVEGADLQSEALINELFEAGCDDATFGRSDGVQYVDFDREATSLGEATLSAVRDLEQFEGVHVTGIVDVDPAPVTETAARTRRSRESIQPLVAAPALAGGRPHATNLSRSVYGTRRSSDVARLSRPGSENKEQPTALSPRSAVVWNDIAAVSGTPLRRDSDSVRRHVRLG